MRKTLIYSLCSKVFKIMSGREVPIKSWNIFNSNKFEFVTLLAEAILQALIMMSSSIRLSLISPQPDWTMYTSSPRTDSPISTLNEHLNEKGWSQTIPNKKTMFSHTASVNIKQLTITKKKIWNSFQSLSNVTFLVNKVSRNRWQS